MYRDFAELDACEGGEARAAILALAAATDRRAVLGRTAVLHLAVFMSAIGAAHGLATHPAVERHRGAFHKAQRPAADGHPGANDRRARAAGHHRPGRGPI